MSKNQLKKKHQSVKFIFKNSHEKTNLQITLQNIHPIT
jgi:hypothetical protein